MSFFTELKAEVEANPAMLETKPAFAPIPNGTYTFVINKAEEEPYVDGAWNEQDRMAALIADPTIVPGKNLSLELEILDGPFKGRKVWDRQTVALASNQQAHGKLTPEAKLEIGRRNLAQLVFKHLKLTEAEWQGWHSLLMRTVSLRIKQSPGKNGKMYYDVVYTGASVTAAAPATVRPVVVADDESAPF